MRKLPTYLMLLAVMLVCITAKVGYASAIDCLTYEYRGNQVTRISDDAPEISVMSKNRNLSGDLLVERVTNEDGRVRLVFTGVFGCKVECDVREIPMVTKIGMVSVPIEYKRSVTNNISIYPANAYHSIIQANPYGSFLSKTKK